MNTIKKERFDFRLDEKLKQELEEAAGLLSVPLSVFVTEAIRERAARVINEHRRLQVDEQAWEMIHSLLENPPEPTERLKSIAARFDDEETWTWQKK
ncbi:DUF1778 domain-containing protein [Atlantibacter hermannii]|uniref:type II toxin-antitoxin system TacA family antitoxin n=1 Tax=Atlantibacter hermannii TaxID=565 RepID=UPI000ED8EC52|nr:DUF1778 domain-containing protein [Atlantibacter hermannii]HAI50453.1 DUF1778 domain-containing protein [Enterobacteriaceae bacterium]